MSHFILKFKLKVLDVNEPSWVAAQCKAWIYACSLVGVAGSNPARRMNVLSRVSVMCCQVEVSDTGQSLVQRRPTEYIHVCVCACVCAYVCH